MIVIHTEWRVAAAILGVAFLILLGVANPKTFIESVSWNLILFLVGSMTFAGILRELGVFRYVAIQILRLSKFNIYILIALISLLSFVLAAVVDEVTSIVYIVMLVFELRRILKISVTPLLVLTVLATNTGSTALPIGNPIGVYILFTSGMPVSMFIRYSLPLALLNLVILFLLFNTVGRGYLRECQTALSSYKKSVEAYISSYYTEVYNAKARRVFIGLVLLIAFVIMVSLNDLIVYALSKILGSEMDPHAFLTFIPYIYVVLSMITAIPPEEVATMVRRAVEWSSIVFFIMLFMLGHSLIYTGAMIKLAYIFSTISTASIALLAITLISSAMLSSILDNLSVIVAFTPIATVFNSIGVTNQLIYFALLFGGVFGGNYTPIGSTANIVAISLAEKRKISIPWRVWLSIALPITTVQIAVSLLWIYIANL